MIIALQNKMTEKVISIISNTDGAQYKFRGELIKYLKEKNNRVVSISSNQSPEGTYTKELQKISSVVYTIPFFRQGIKCIISPLILYNIIRREKSDVVHIYGHESLLLSIFAVIFIKNPKYILTITGLGRFFKARQGIFRVLIKGLIILIYRLTLPYLKKVIFLNKHDYDFFSRKFENYAKKFVILNGEGSSFKKSDSPILKATRNYNFLFASRIMEEKGIIELIKAFILLPRPFHLNILGSIDQKLVNNPIIVSLTKNKFCNISYHGFVKDINSFMDSCECVVLPSKYMEGLPIILVEALAKGKLILTTNAPGCSETVMPGLNGVIVNELNESNLHKAFYKIRDLDSIKGGKISLELFENIFSSEKINQKILDIYNI